jgi:flagellar assembly factor FliW
MEYYKLNVESLNKMITSKAGLININPMQSIHFPSGIIGLPKEKNFCLVSCALEKFRNRNFLVLQSIDNYKIKFMVLPISLDEVHDYKKSELINTYESLGINADDARILLIIAKKFAMRSTILVANINAPILIDYKTMNGLQVELSSMN